MNKRDTKEIITKMREILESIVEHINDGEHHTYSEYSQPHTDEEYRKFHLARDIGVLQNMLTNRYL
jgi:hypothetical protein